jgi:hypothetical protein
VPAALINVPFTRLSVAIGGQILGGYATVILPNGSLTGFFAGPITFPEWCDLTRPIRMFFYHQEANAAGAGQAIGFNLRTVTSVDGSSNYNQDNPFTLPIPTTGQGALQRVEYLDDNTYPDPLYPGGQFAPGTSIGWLLTREGSAANDTYTFTAQVAAYLELQIFKRCQKICC